MLKTKKYLKIFIKYSFYMLVLLIVLDVVSTYLGIKYFNLYEANEKTARLFDVLGIFVPSILKIGAVLLFGYIIKITLKRLDSLMHDTNAWMNSLAIISTLNIILVILTLNVVYIIVDLRNLNLLYAFL